MFPLISSTSCAYFFWILIVSSSDFSLSVEIFVFFTLNNFPLSLFKCSVTLHHTIFKPLDFDMYITATFFNVFSFLVDLVAFLSFPIFPFALFACLTIKDMIFIFKSFLLGNPISMSLLSFRKSILKFSSAIIYTLFFPTISLKSPIAKKKHNILSNSIAACTSQNKCPSPRDRRLMLIHTPV